MSQGAATTGGAGPGLRASPAGPTAAPAARPAAGPAPGSAPAGRAAPATPRAAALVVVCAVLVGWGWGARWPEVTALGAAGLAAWAVVALLTARTPVVGLAAESAALRVVRGQPAALRITLAPVRRGGWLRLVEGDPAAPARTLPVRRADLAGPAVLRFPLDTSRRGQRVVGPFRLVHGDPWGLVRRQVAAAPGGVLTVQPRVHPVRPALLAARGAGESDAASRRLGERHFHALRDYVLGDEPRLVHWRSSARAGKLVVRQQVASSTTGTTVVLDVDVSAYGADDQFGAAWLPQRFEEAVEAAASLAAARHAGPGRAAGEQVHLVTTAAGSPVASAPAGAVGPLLDALAVVEALPPLRTAPEELYAVVRRTRCARLVVVTGTPGHRTRAAVQAAAGLVGSAVVVRVGSRRPEPVGALRVVDVDGAGELG